MTTTKANHPKNRSARRFTRHYVEMVIAMFAGMLVLGAPLELVLRAVGTSSGAIEDSAPAVMLLEMAIIMTIHRTHRHADPAPVAAEA
jgi:cytochrome c oxidase assembly factor CtaG